MNRVLVRPNQQVQDVDILNTNDFAEISLGHLIALVMGQVTAIGGLVCTPATPANMTVIVGPGSIYSLQNLESTAYGSDPADTAHQLMKQGTNLDPTTLTLAAPTTSGNSIVYLIQAAYAEADSGSQTIPFKDSVTGVVTQQTVNTVRQSSCLINAKAGTSAATGSATAPAPDAGYTGLYTVTVAQGQTTITSTSIAKVAGAPFFPKLSGLGSLATLNAGAGLYLDGLGNLAARNARETLTANRTYYVSPGGSDAATGLSAGAAWATTQHAVGYIQQFIDLAGFTVTIQHANGTYTTGVTVTGPFTGGGQVIIAGNTTTPANCLFNTVGNCFTVSNGATVSLQGLRLTTTGTGWGIYAQDSAQVYIIGMMDFGPLGGSGTAHMEAEDGARILLFSSYAISGSAPFHWQSGRGGGVSDQNAAITITVSAPITVTAFASANVNASIYLGGTSFVGSTVTGVKYSSTTNSTICTNNKGAGYIPGTAAGTTSTGGQYY